MLVYRKTDGWMLGAVLPPARMIFELLELPTSLLGAIKSLESESMLNGRGHRPSDSTIRAIEKGAASKKSEGRLAEYLPDYLLPDDSCIEEYSRSGGSDFSRHEWKSVISSLQGKGIIPELEPFFCYIEERIVKEEALQNKVYPDNGRGAPCGDMLEAIGEYLDIASFFGGVEVRNEEAFMNLCHSGRFGPDQELRTIISFELDFIFGALRSVERGIISFWMDKDPDFLSRYPLIYKEGIFSLIMPLIKGDKIVGPFHRLLVLLRNRFSEEERSWVSLSDDFPVKNQSAYTDSELKQKRKGLLTKWRKFERKSCEKVFPLNNIIVDIINRRMQNSEGVMGVIIISITAKMMERILSMHINFSEQFNFDGNEDVVIQEYRRYQEFRRLDMLKSGIDY
ncbi:MAG: hypothetical protein C0462_10305 [Alcanivorax sp.]|nr:hypothetical protein [Alcanivorax sp.]